MATKGGVICREGRQQEPAIAATYTYSDKENAPCLVSSFVSSFSVNIVAHYQAHLSLS